LLFVGGKREKQMGCVNDGDEIVLSVQEEIATEEKRCLAMTPGRRVLSYGIATEAFGKGHPASFVMVG
jgi:hypothetical protein